MTPARLKSPTGLDLVSVRRCDHGVIRRAWYSSDREPLPVERMDVVAYRSIKGFGRCEKCDGPEKRRSA